MKKSERWLTSVAIIAGVLPLILMAFMMKLLPLNVQVDQFPLAPGKEELPSGYNFLLTGIFCVVPMAIVLIARYVKAKIVVYPNYPAILGVSILLSLSFSGIAVFGVVSQITDPSKLEGFDYIGFSCVVISILFALFANVLRYRKFKAKIGIHNKYTRSSSSVWKTVHHNISTVQVWVFTFVAVVSAYIEGWRSFIIFGSALAAFFIWVYIYSFNVSKWFLKRQVETEAVKESDFNG